MTPKPRPLDGPAGPTLKSTEMSSSAIFPRSATPTNVTIVQAAQAATDRYWGGGPTRSDAVFGIPVTYENGPVGAGPVATVAITDSFPFDRAIIFGRAAPSLLVCAMSHPSSHVTSCSVGYCNLGSRLPVLKMVLCILLTYQMTRQIFVEPIPLFGTR